MLLLDFLFGFLGGFASYLILNYSNRLLNKPDQSMIINPRATLPKKNQGKHTPKALTDLMAYQKEIEEGGQNRV